MPNPTYAILQAVVRSASAFLRSGNLSTSLCALLAGIGEATQASRAYVFQIDPSLPGGGLTATQVAEWTATGVAPQFGTPEVRNMQLEASGFDEWLDGFTRGTPFVALVAELPERPRGRLSRAGIKSIAAVPIFAEQEFWGFLGVDDCETERRWTTIEVDSLNTAAAVVGASILRQRTETALLDATMKAKLAADIGEVVTRAGDTVQQMLDRCSAAIVRHLNPDLVRIWMLSEDRACLIGCTQAGAVSIQNAELDDLPLFSDALSSIACSTGVTEWRTGLPDLWPGSTAEFGELGLTGGIGMPLMTNGRTNGIVVLLGRAFPAAAIIDALESVTDEIALAIERHQAQGARSRADLRYRRLVEATVEGILIHDGTKVVDANPCFAAMLGYTPEEVIGRNPFDFICLEYHAFVREQLLSNYQKPYEVEGLRRDGSRFPVELKGNDFLDEGRTLRVAAVRDITDRKAVQHTTEQLREEQHARALAERTREQAEFLAEASRILAASLDTTTTLTQLAHLTVPKLGDYCVVSLFDGTRIHRVAIVHADPVQEPILRASVAVWPAQFPDSHPIYSALANNRSFIAAELTDATLSSIASSDDHHNYLKLMRPTSLMAVPISSAGVVLGSILLCSVRKERRFGADDLALAEEFANRAALALIAARSYHTAQEAVQDGTSCLPWLRTTCAILSTPSSWVASSRSS